MYDFKRITACLKHLGVPVIISNQQPYTACLAMTKEGYKIYVKDFFQQLDDDLKAVILAHELAHLLRGDCLRIKAKTIDPMKWNIAADACINETKRPQLEQLEDYFDNHLGQPIRVVFKDRLINAGSLPESFADKLAGTKEIYDNLNLENNNDDDNDNNGDGESDGFGDSSVDGLTIDSGVSQHEAQRHHAKTILNAREIKKELEDIGISPSKDISGFSSAQAVGKNGYEAVNPLPVYSIDPLIKALSSRRGERRRSFRREGRIESTPRLLPLKNKKVAIYIDISGSMEGIATVAKAVAAYLVKYDVEWYLFGSQVTKISSLHQIPTSGLCDGTNFDCIFDSIPTGRQIIVITDGECYLKHPERVPEDTIWAVIGSALDRLPGHVVQVNQHNV